MGQSMGSRVKARNDMGAQMSREGVDRDLRWHPEAGREEGAVEEEEPGDLVVLARAPHDRASGIVAEAQRPERVDRRDGERPRIGHRIGDPVDFPGVAEHSWGRARHRHLAGPGGDIT